MTNYEDAITLCAAGDICVNRDNPESIFELTSAVTREADITFGQLETNFSERGTPLVSCARPLRAHPRNVSALAFAGFDIVSMAGNHVLDYGTEALTETMEVLERNNIRTVGAGQNIAEARSPVVIERKGIRVVFLAYNSILPHRYWADEKRPGCAPVRITTSYEPYENGQPGCPVKILTHANRDDLEAMKSDIANAKTLADVVVVSLHGGLHLEPATLPTYQPEVARAAVDAGADLILGTHAHILKGMEIYKGKLITYCLSNFAFDMYRTAKDFEDPHVKQLVKLFPHYKFEKDYPTFAFPADSRKSMLLKCQISKQGIRRISFLPVLINTKGQPEILTRDNDDWSVVFNYMDELCKPLGTKISAEGDEVLIHQH